MMIITHAVSFYLPTVNTNWPRLEQTQSNLTMSKSHCGWTVVMCVFAFSLALGVCALSFKSDKMCVISDTIHINLG